LSFKNKTKQTYKQTKDRDKKERGWGIFCIKLNRVLKNTQIFKNNA
jgi:hypothetical protein